jgi:ATP-dependent DNA helicase RecQ
MRCRRQVLLAYFGDTLEEPCGNCDTCLSPAIAFDGTEAARKALSAVYRTGERFGAGHVIDVLMGAETERIASFGHDALSVYGVGKEFGRTEWRSIFRQLTALGLLIVDTGGHGGLHLGPDCRAVLRGERHIELRREEGRRRKSAAERAAKRAGAAGLEDDAGMRALFEALRARRATLAKAQGVPPYVIFHDTTLIEIARRQPRSLDELAGITGVGQAKLARYGEIFVGVVREHAM